MDFHQVTSTLLRDFENEGIRYAVIGGFALGFWGATRATIDMDFLLRREDVERTEEILSKYHYRCIQKTVNVGQYVSDHSTYGTVDFIFAARNVSKKMLDRSVVVEFGTEKVKVLIPEDIIGLKVQALSNDPSREIKDYADIDALLSARLSKPETINWVLLREYFELFDKLELYFQLANRYDAPDRSG